MPGGIIYKEGSWHLIAIVESNVGGYIPPHHEMLGPSLWGIGVEPFIQGRPMLACGLTTG